GTLNRRDRHAPPHTPDPPRTDRPHAVGGHAARPFAAGQTAAPASDTPVTIRFYNYNFASTGLGRDGTEEMLAAIAARPPTITVEGVPVT
ncbi:MAG: hypothetical protein ACK4OP_18460, partial [Gemmobacter sp.]